MAIKFAHRAASAAPSGVSSAGSPGILHFLSEDLRGTGNSPRGNGCTRARWLIRQFDPAPPITLSATHLNPRQHPWNRRNATKLEFARNGGSVAPPGGGRFKRDPWYSGPSAQESRRILGTIEDNKLTKNARSAWLIIEQLTLYVINLHTQTWRAI